MFVLLADTHVRPCGTNAIRARGNQISAKPCTELQTSTLDFENFLGGWRGAMPPNSHCGYGLKGPSPCLTPQPPYWNRWLAVSHLSNAVVTCEIKLFQNYFSLRRRPSEIILCQRVETCLKLFQNYFTGLLLLTNIFQHVQCRWNNFEIILELLRRLKEFYLSFRRGYAWNNTLWNTFEIISALYFRCSQLRWLHAKYNTEIISKLFQNNFILHVTTAQGAIQVAVICLRLVSYT